MLCYTYVLQTHTPEGSSLRNTNETFVWNSEWNEDETISLELCASASLSQQTQPNLPEHNLT